MRHRNIVMRSWRVVINRLLGLADGHGRGDEDSITPYDGRGVAFAGDWNLPTDVIALTPSDGRIRMGRHAIGLRSAPLRPVTSDLSARTPGDVISQPRQRQQAAEERKMGAGLEHVEA